VNVLHRLPAERVDGRRQTVGKPAVFQTVEFLIDEKLRSLKVYREKYHPQIALRFSMQNLHEDDGLINIPLYLLSRYTVFLPQKR
jgi:hypothetical protein